MNNTPKISVFTSCLNSGKYLKETINSILAQDFKDFEIIIVDAGSTDETPQILDNYKTEKRIKVIVEPGINGQDGFIRAFHETSGLYVMCMPISDSYNSKSWFKKCFDILDHNQDISLVHGISIHNNNNNEYFFGSTTHTTPPSGKDFLAFWLSTYFAFGEHTYCVRRNIFDECLKKPLPIDFEIFESKFDLRTIERTDFFFNWCLQFIYNFHTRGYLSEFVPNIAALVRINENQLSVKRKKIDGITGEFYTELVRDYKDSLLKRKAIHVFRNGKGNIIDTLAGSDLKNLSMEVTTYRLFEKIYFSHKDSLNTFGQKSVFRIKRTIARIVRTFTWYFGSTFFRSKIN